MYSITGTTIKMTRGDTFIATISLKQGNSTYTPVAGDVIRFYLGYKRLTADRSAYATEGAIITKEVDISDMTLRLDPEDTKGLGFGTYVYDLEMTFADGRVDTFVEGKDFIISPEVE